MKIISVSPNFLIFPDHFGIPDFSRLSVFSRWVVTLYLLGFFVWQITAHTSTVNTKMCEKPAAVVFIVIHKTNSNHVHNVHKFIAQEHSPWQSYTFIAQTLEIQRLHLCQSTSCRRLQMCRAAEKNKTNVLKCQGRYIWESTYDVIIPFILRQTTKSTIICCSLTANKTLLLDFKAFNP